MSSSLSPMMIGAIGEEIGQGSGMLLGQGSVSGVWRSVVSCGNGGTVPRPCAATPLRAKRAPHEPLRRIVDSEVDEARPTDSFSASSCDWIADGAAELRRVGCDMSAGASRLDCPVDGDNVISDCCAVLALEAVLDDMAASVRLD